MSEPTLHIFRGLQGSGKSTDARLLRQTINDVYGQAVIVERDQIRFELFNSYWTGNHEDEKKVSAIQKERIHAFLKAGVDVISSDTNLRDRDVKTLMEIAYKVGAEVLFVERRDVPLEVCIARDAARHRTVGEAILRDRYERFIKGRKLEDVVYEPSGKVAKDDFDFDSVEKYVAPVGGRRTILLDIDGTVANHEGVRHPHDTTKYREDTVHEDVRDIIWSLWNDDFDIVVFSGRHEDFREDLEWWLNNNHFPPMADIIMREREGTRDDYEKLYLFEKHIRNNPDIAVHSVFDDRNRVVFNTWRRALKIRCFHAAWGDF